MSLSTKYWQLMLTQGIMTGLGGGLFFTPSLGLVGTYFNKKRALAIGIATTGNSAGGIVYPVLVQQLLPKLGFAWTSRVLGFLNLGILCVVFVFMRPRCVKYFVKRDMSLLICEFDRLPPRKSGPTVDLSAFRESTYSLLVAGLFFVIWSVYFTFYYRKLQTARANITPDPLTTSTPVSSYGSEVIGLPFTSATTITIVLNGYVRLTSSTHPSTH